MRARLLTALAGLVAQLVFVAAGVYLGMRADEARERRGRREAARATLTNLREELRGNRAQVVRVLPYHRELAESLLALQARGTPVRDFAELQRAVRWTGFRPIGFRHAAWDLALANQSLGWVDPTVAFPLADLYEAQASFARYQDATLYGVVSPAGLRTDAIAATAFTLAAFFSDAAKYQEPGLVRAYDQLLPRVDSALARLGR
jgi:hypothetical protein